MNLEGEVALVTGASRGIGQAIAQKLAFHGALVVGTSTTQGGADGISAALQERGYGGRGMILDVTQPENIPELIKKINNEFGAVTVLINNAGITRDNLLMRMKVHDWDLILATDLSSVYHLSKACLRGMMKLRKGRVINISSVVGLIGNAGQSNYAAAKAGMIGFTKSLAREVAARGITVNAVAPGFIDTEMTRALTEEQRRELLSQIPLSRLGRGEDVADTVVFLASAGAAYITGETINVNGGMYMP